MPHLLATLALALLAALGPSSMPSGQQARPSVPQQVANARGRTWRCQAALGRRRTRAATPAWQLAPGPYRGWVLTRWRHRAHACAAERQRRYLAASSWLAAVEAVQRPYPGTRAWLLSCSRTGSEGGWGRWVPNAQGSGAGGWMQYMAGTWQHDHARALADVQARGYIVPRHTHSWYHPLGQALAAAWAYPPPPGKWTGYGC